MKRIITAVGAVVALLALVAAPGHASPGAVPAAGASLPTAVHAADARASVEDAFTVQDARTEADGVRHLRYQRTYRGLRVAGGEIVVHGRADGGYAGTSVGLIAPLSLSTEAMTTAAQAARAARAAFTGAIAEVGRPENFVDATSGRGVLAWETVVGGYRPDGQTPSRLHVVTDATTGSVIRSFDEISVVASAAAEPIAAAAGSTIAVAGTGQSSTRGPSPSTPPSPALLTA
ncbi:Zn-dependent metalloprotease [Allocatelliglobosispora scoriae]|uniref:Zn-dependent metalloprotease n=1 Tax=Allocatelliglobosispora scoriae TaxID=643052 RepID=A0A841BF40_9ACTN|nr:hypothetical protein [Allocatelliglobosispora scoriae]MBB5866914.1 Zn-dependent metalloprotease [Allocatelliglobosispora scoriae]